MTQSYIINIYLSVLRSCEEAEVRHGRGESRFQASVLSLLRIRSVRRCHPPLNRRQVV